MEADSRGETSTSRRTHVHNPIDFISAERMSQYSMSTTPFTQDMNSQMSQRSSTAPMTQSQYGASQLDHDDGMSQASGFYSQGFTQY
jgi:hypothetical protein